MSSLKETYGWSLELEKFLKDDDKSIPKGRFSLQIRSGKYYWYYNLSSGNTRLLYLCSVDDKGSDDNSFRNSLRILRKKLKSEQGLTQKRVKLVNVIDKYIDNLLKEGRSVNFGVERTQKTIYDLTYHLRTFRDFVERNEIHLSDCVNVEFGNTFINYVSELKLRYKPNTIRRHITTVKLFFNDLVEPKSGKPIISSHLITPLFLKRNFNFKKDNSTPEENFYSEDVFNELFNLCGIRVREIWTRFLQKGKESIKTSELVYFVTLLQLNYGFRIGEIIKCYCDKEYFTRYYPGKGGYSYLEKDTDDHNYTFHIFTKGRFGKVYVDYSVFSWIEPPEGFSLRRLSSEEFKSKPYITNIVEIILFLFSGPSQLVSMDRTYYFKYFKKHIVEEEGFGKYGINTTHDLRDMCINYLIHTKGYSPTEISQLTRHSIHTLETYYLHRSKKISIQLSEKLKTKGRYGEVKKNMKVNKTI